MGAAVGELPHPADRDRIRTAMSSPAARGIPDGCGWDAFFGLRPTPQLEEATRLHRYDAIFARYADFDEMFAHEDVALVNPLVTREEQLANIRRIHPPERDTLGVVAIGIELVNPPQTFAEPHATLGP